LVANWRGEKNCNLKEAPDLVMEVIKTCSSAKAFYALLGKSNAGVRDTGGSSVWRPGWG